MEQPAGRGRRSGISLDALVLVLVSGYTLHQESFYKSGYTTPTLAALAVGLVGLYLLIDVLGQPLAASDSARWRRAYYGGKGAALAGIVALLVIWPTIHFIVLRHTTQPWLYVHDTSINVEEATKFLLAGKDPYTQTYFNTPLAKFVWHGDPKYGYGPNPALWMTDTFPGQELITVPFYLASHALLGWFDERFIYFAAFAATVVLLLRLAPTPTTRLALLAGVTLNPLWVTTFIYGQNDILVLAEILAVLDCALHRRWRLAMVALAIGCATKQTTLLLVPFYVWWLLPRLGQTWPQRLDGLARLLPWLLVPLILLVGPFAAWNWKAFYDGNFGYVAGTVPHSYPIQGYDAYGAASFVLWSGLVPGPRAYFPFWVLEVGFAAPLTVLLLRRMRAATPLTVMLGAYATILFGIFYFSRFFHQSYAAFVLALLMVAYFAHRPARRSADDGHLSFDVLVPLILVPQFIDPPTNRAQGITAAITFGLLLAYVVVAALAPWGRLRRPSSRRMAAAARALLLAGLAQVTIFAPAFTGIYNRLRWNSGTAFIHDTALQIQISAGALLAHVNPYTMSFTHTPLAGLYIPPFKVKEPLQPALPLLHNPHLPLEFLLGAPLQALFNGLQVFFDERYLYLPALLLAALLLAALVEVPARQLALVSAVVFSPLFVDAVMLGQDDVLVVLVLAVALLLLRRRHYAIACLAAGVALALKLTAWPLAPLLLAYLAGVDRQRLLSVRRGAANLLGRVLALLAPLVASSAPFLLWNAPALIQDALAYPLGLMRDAIPLDLTWGAGFQTLGFGRIARDVSWAAWNGDGYIGPWLALALGLPCCAVLMLRLWRAPGLPLLMAGYLVLLFVLEYFGRFMTSTALGYLAVLAPLAFFLPAPTTTIAQVSPLPLPAPTPDEQAIAV